MRKHQLLWIAALMALCFTARANDTQWDFLQFGFGPNYPDSQDSVAVYGTRIGLPVCGGKAAVNGLEFAVAGALSERLIVETGRIVAADLRRRFRIAAPRLGIAGLNPHAGEGGTMGTEEETIIRPAIAALEAEGIVAIGPLPADTMFHRAGRARYDAALCMYHDQALIPAKTLAFAETVNVTLGLAFVRTSPDHGTALDIAGTGKADPSSLAAALRLAAELAANDRAQ